jgi:Putative metal-binding motif
MDESGAGSSVTGGRPNQELRPMKRTLCLVSFLTLAAPQSAQTVFFWETFDNNNAGWATDPTWQIGPAMTSTGQNYGYPDPGTDANGVMGGGVAGVAIGGNAPTSLHPYYYLTSPMIPLPGGAPRFLTFRRWLNSDYWPFMQSNLEVFNGYSWVSLWSSSNQGVTDNAWQSFTFDVTAYSAPNFRVRFGQAVTAVGAFVVSSWNIDDVRICSAVVTYADADGDSFGDPAAQLYVTNCAIPAGYVTNNGDCDDSNAAVNPLATEICNGLDDDCDGSVDEGIPAVSQTYGFGCPAAMTFTGTLPVIGQFLTVGIASALPNAPGILLMSNPSSPPYHPLGGGCELYLDNGSILVVFGIATNPGGNWSFTVQLPNDPGLQCVDVRLQAVFPTLLGLQVTNGLRLVFGV